MVFEKGITLAALRPA